MNGIGWCDFTANSIHGCSRVSPGCMFCYASDAGRSLSDKGQESYSGLTRLDGRGHYAWNGRLRFVGTGVIDRIAKSKNHRRIFLNSMSDVFHEKIMAQAPKWTDAILRCCARYPHQTFLILTKRPELAAKYLREWSERGLPVLRHVLIGFSAENQETFDERKVHAQVVAELGWRTFVSVEPQLGPVVLGDATKFLSWVISGGEYTMPYSQARPFCLEWGQSIVDECVAAKVPVYFKQMGANPFVSISGIMQPVDKTRQGKKLKELPKSLQVKDKAPAFKVSAAYRKQLERVDWSQLNLPEDYLKEID